jgi:hypothetical protein
MTKEDVDKIFVYHPPSEQQAELYAELRETARAFALAVLQWTPGSGEQTLAIRHIQQAVMFANAAIAIHTPEPQRDDDDIPF